MKSNEQKRTIDGLDVSTETKLIEGLCSLEVEVGTNGYHGGDSEHGCRTYVRFQNLASADIRVTLVLNELDETICGFELTLGGDSELDAIIKALRFAAETLESEKGNK